MASERFAGRGAAVAAGARHRRGEIVVAALDEVAAPLRALQDEAGAELVAGTLDGGVEERLVGDDAPRLDAAGGGDDELRRGVVDAGRKLRRGEAAEDDGMHRADAGAGEHGDDRLRHHRHIEDDAVALADAEIAQHRAERLGLRQQLGVGDACAACR